MRKENRLFTAAAAAVMSASVLLSGVGAVWAEEAETEAEEYESSELGDFFSGILDDTGLSELIEGGGSGAVIGIGAIGAGLAGELGELGEELGEGLEEGFAEFGDIMSGNMVNLADYILDGMLELTEADKLPTTYPLTIDNGDGKELVIEEEPQRIVSVSPSLTEIIYALGAGDKLIARSDYCNYPEEVLEKESVGQIYGADIEKILSLEPDLVVASAHFPDESIAQLEDAGIKVLYLYEEQSLEDAITIITTVGDVLNRRPEARKLTGITGGRIALTALYVYPEEPISLYYVVGYGEYGDYTATGDTYINELLKCAGVKNIAEDAQGWSFSTEKLLEEDPEVILVPEYAYDDFIVTEPYTELTAVKEGKVYAVNNDMLDRQSPRNADVVVEIARLLHPEVFEKMEKDDPRIYSFLTGTYTGEEAEEEEALTAEEADETLTEENAA